MLAAVKSVSFLAGSSSSKSGHKMALVEIVMWGGQPAMHVHALGIWTKHSGQFSMLPLDICILQLKLVNQICQEQLNKF